MRIVRKANIKEELKPIIEKAAKKGADAGNIGIEAFLTIIEALSEQGAEKQIYFFLAGPFEMDPNEIENLELDKLQELFEQLGAENDLMGFFGSLLGLMNTK